jgi:hypothetical protein
MRMVHIKGGVFNSPLQESFTKLHCHIYNRVGAVLCDRPSTLVFSFGRTQGPKGYKKILYDGIFNPCRGE